MVKEFQQDSVVAYHGIPQNALTRLLLERPQNQMTQREPLLLQRLAENERVAFRWGAAVRGHEL